MSIEKKSPKPPKPPPDDRRLEIVARRLNDEGLDGLRADYKWVCSQDQDFPSAMCDKSSSLNRWSDIHCFDNTRVVLQKCGGNNKYIHANYVDGYEAKHKYICTQGPMKNTIVDFWQMVWQLPALFQQKALVLVALTKMGGGKCDIYFPQSQNNSETYGQITVMNLGIRHITSYDALLLQVSHNAESRRILLLIYYEWPDKGTPDSCSQILRFLAQIDYNQKKRVEEMADKKDHPIVVHCSAGIGRTGTLVGLDIICRQLDHTSMVEQNPKLDLPGVVVKMRAQRAKMVQKFDQYIFLFMASIEYALTKKYISPSDVDITTFLQLPTTCEGDSKPQ